MLTRLLFLSGIALVISSCSALIDVDAQQCTKDADCVALGAAFAGSVCDHSLCVMPTETTGGEAGSPSEVPPDPLKCTPVELSSEDKVKYSFAPVFAPGAEPAEPKPFTIKACEQLDLDCAHPVFGPIDVIAGEPQDFLVRPGFAGFFAITNPDTIDGLLFLGRPVNDDTVGWNVTMPTPQVVSALAFATGENVDPELGLVLSVARDCSGSLLEHVTFSNSKGGLGYYFVMNLPDSSLTETGPQGAAGYANVPISTTILTGVHESGAMLGPVSVRVKPHTLSFAEIWP
jgi:hypothetical protein